MKNGDEADKSTKMFKAILYDVLSDFRRGSITLLPLVSCKSQKHSFIINCDTREDIYFRAP